MVKRRRKPKVVPASSEAGKLKIAEAIQEMRDRGELPEKRLGEDNGAVVMIRVNPIAWGIPFDEVVFSKWVQHLVGTIRIMPWDDTIFASSTYLPDARNIIHSRFVEESKCEWLLMLDSDVLPPPGFEHTLLKHIQNDEEIRMVGGWYKMKDGSKTPVVYHTEEPPDDKGIIDYSKYGPGHVGKGLEEVVAAGAGIWLMHREVAEAIGPKPYSMTEGGEDLALCRKVRDAGFKLFIDWDIAAAHCGVAVA